VNHMAMVGQILDNNIWGYNNYILA